MRVFVLEDDITRIKFFENKFEKHDLCVASSVINGKWVLPGYPEWDLAFFDHDVETDYNKDGQRLPEDSGHDLAKWVVAQGIPVKRIIVHSMNPVGAQNIFNVFNDAGYNVVCVNYSDLERSLMVN